PATVLREHRLDRRATPLHGRVDLACHILLGPVQRQIWPSEGLSLLAAQPNRVDEPRGSLLTVGRLLGARAPLTNPTIFEHQPLDGHSTSCRKQERNATTPRVTDERNLSQTERRTQASTFFGLVGEA